MLFLGLDAVGSNPEGELFCFGLRPRNRLGQGGVKAKGLLEDCVGSTELFFKKSLKVFRTLSSHQFQRDLST